MSRAAHAMRCLCTSVSSMRGVDAFVLDENTCSTVLIAGFRTRVRRQRYYRRRRNDRLPYTTVFLATACKTVRVLARVAILCVRPGGTDSAWHGLLSGDARANLAA